MIVQSCLWIFLVFLHIKELCEDILIIFPAVKTILILHIIGLCHIQPVEPDLVRVDLFVPEVPFLCAGHLEDLLIDLLCRPGILFLAG